MTAGVRLIRISTRRTGERVVVRVYVYDDLQALRDAALRYSPHEPGFFDDCYGVCQTFVITENDSDEVVYESPVTVRLWRGSLGIKTVAHELSHAACEIYGRSIGASADSARSHLHNANETLAYLHSDLCGALIDRFWALGYYDSP